MEAEKHKNRFTLVCRNTSSIERERESSGESAETEKAQKFLEKTNKLNIDGKIFSHGRRIVALVEKNRIYCKRRNVTKLTINENPFRGERS